MKDNLDNPLWTYALNVYDDCNVRECLHTLQDASCLNINYILASLYLTHRGQYMTAKQWAQVIASCSGIEGKCSEARQQRLSLKTGDHESYQKAKQYELLLEQRHLAIIFKQLEAMAVKACAFSTAMDNIEAFYSSISDKPLDTVNIVTLFEPLLYCIQHNESI